jgi:hypothetical protein
MCRGYARNNVPCDGYVSAARSPAVPRLLHPWPQAFSSTTALHMPLWHSNNKHLHMQVNELMSAQPACRIR